MNHQKETPSLSTGCITGWHASEDGDFTDSFLRFCLTTQEYAKSQSILFSSPSSVSSSTTKMIDRPYRKVCLSSTSLQPPLTQRDVEKEVRETLLNIVLALKEDGAAAVVLNVNDHDENECINICDDDTQWNFSNQYIAIEFLSEMKNKVNDAPLICISFAIARTLNQAETFLQDCGNAEELAMINCSRLAAAHLCQYSITKLERGSLTDFESNLQVHEGIISPANLDDEDYDDHESDCSELNQATIETNQMSKEDEIMHHKSITFPRVLSYLLALLVVLIAGYITLLYQNDPIFISGRERWGVTEPLDETLDNIAILSTDKSIVVTGASAGLGLASVKLLAQANTANIVIMACRDLQKCHAAKQQVMDAVDASISKEGTSSHLKWRRKDPKHWTKLVTMELDLASIPSIQTFAREIQDTLLDNSDTMDKNQPDASTAIPKIDVLINNAGIMGVPYQIAHSTNAEIHMHVNHMGHFALSSLLTKNLEGGGRIVNVSSLMGAVGPFYTYQHWLERVLQYEWFGDFESYPFQLLRSWSVGLQRFVSYSASKRANLLFTNALNQRFLERGIDIDAVVAHPGYSRTTLFRGWSSIPSSCKEFMATNRIASMSSDVGALSQLRAALDLENVKGNAYVGPILGVVGRPVILGTAARSPHHLFWPLLGEESSDELWKISEDAIGWDYF